MLSQVKRARGRLAAVRAQVLSSSPEEVEQCIPALQEAIACLQDRKPGHDASLLAELRGLQFEIGVVSRLVERSEEFYQGWAKILAATAAGYTALSYAGLPYAALPDTALSYTGLSYTETGNPAPPPAASGSLSVRG